MGISILGIVDWGMNYEAFLGMSYEVVGMRYKITTEKNQLYFTDLLHRNRS